MMRFLSELTSVVLLFIISTVSLSSYGASGFEKVPTDPSVVRIEDSFGVCTGTRTSSYGHILTARHCFNACLISGDFVDVERLYPEVGWQSPKLYRLSHSKKAICSVKIDGKEQQVEILAASAGFMTPIEQSSFEIYDKAKYLEFLNKFYLHNGDYAVIKVINDQRDHACKKIRKSKVTLKKQREVVHYIGYPGPTTGRPEDRNSDGKNLFLSHGLVVESILENSCLERSLNKSSVQVKYDRPELLLSTVDDIPGASGSALLDRDNQIIGLINSVYKDKIDVYSEYCSGSTVALDIHFILSEMKKTLSSTEMSHIFQCTK